MRRIGFYLQYAARNLWRNRRWSAFAVFSIGAGVATVVALRSLGLAIGDSLTSNVRNTLHGDMTFSTQSGGFLQMGDPKTEDVFTSSQLKTASDWTAAHGGKIATFIQSGGIQVTALGATTVGRPQFISTLFIDPRSYPPTDDIRTLDPPGARLQDLFQGGNEVIVSENLAQSQNIKVGDHVRVSGTEEQFVVRGIAPTTAEANFSNIFAAFFGFAYFDSQSMSAKLPIPGNPNRISIALPDGTTPDQIESSMDDLYRQLQRGGYIRTESVPELLDTYKRIADVVGSFIVVLGLGALLIGGVGIINTMLVLVRRRTEEIAALKTFGVKGRQVAAMFLAEAFLLGLAGSLLGGVFGVALSAVANAYGTALIQQPLVWRVHLDAVLFGLALGLVVSVVFGVVPVLTAVRVRPAIILRPNETHIVGVGILQSLGAILIVVLVIGLIAGQILAPTFAAAQFSGGPARRAVVRAASSGLFDPNVVGILSVAGTLAVLGVLIGLLWMIVWLVGKLPSFGWVDLRLALRNLSTRRIRTATTLLALSAGMFALSSIAFFGAGAREIVQFTLSESFGGNVLLFPVLPPAIAQPLIDARVNTMQGVIYRTRLANYSGQIVAVNGQEVVSSGDPGGRSTTGVIPGANAKQAARAAARDLVRGNSSFSTYVQVVMRDTTNPNFNSGLLEAGRDLTLEDRGKPVAVIKDSPEMQRLGVALGSKIRVHFATCSGACDLEFEVVGVRPETSIQNLQSAVSFGDLIVPGGSLPGIAPQFQFNTLQIDPAHLNQALLDLSSVPLVFALDISFIDGLLSRFIDMMSALPILVGLLSLFAAAVIMANTVALATLERRRQIGILKSIGLKGRRILRIMLLENTLVSLLGGLIGLGLSALGVWIMTTFGLSAAQLVPGAALPVAIALVVAAVVIGWVATFLSAQVAIRERVLNVLRYE